MPGKRYPGNPRAKFWCGWEELTIKKLGLFLAASLTRVDVSLHILVLLNIFANLFCFEGRAWVVLELLSWPRFEPFFFLFLVLLLLRTVEA